MRVVLILLVISLLLTGCALPGNQDERDQQSAAAPAPVSRDGGSVADDHRINLTGILWDTDEPYTVQVIPYGLDAAGDRAYTYQAHQYLAAAVDGNPAEGGDDYVVFDHEDQPRCDDGLQGVLLKSTPYLSAGTTLDFDAKGVHCDAKPWTIFLDDDGSPVLLPGDNIQYARAEYEQELKKASEAVFAKEETADRLQVTQAGPDAHWDAFFLRVASGQDIRYDINDAADQDDPIADGATLEEEHRMMARDYVAFCSATDKAEKVTIEVRTATANEAVAIVQFASIDACAGPAPEVSFTKSEANDRFSVARAGAGVDWSEFRADTPTTGLRFALNAAAEASSTPINGPTSLPPGTMTAGDYVELCSTDAPAANIELAIDHEGGQDVATFTFSSIATC